MKVKGTRRCVKPTKRNAAKPRCNRYSNAGTLRASASAGPNKLALTGKIGRRSLTPGAYRLILTATDPAGQRSTPIRRTFTVLRP